MLRLTDTRLADFVSLSLYLIWDQPKEHLHP
jgi:hypothetical protein